MTKTLLQVSRQPFYVWMLGVFPILHLYSENLGLIIDNEVITACAAILAATTIAFFIANCAIRCRFTTANLLSSASLVYSMSGHIYVFIFMPRSLFIWTLLSLIALAIVLLVVWKKGSRELFLRLSPIFNLIMLVLLIFPSSKIVTRYFSEKVQIKPITAYYENKASYGKVPKVNDSESRPDIYFIIPDGYLQDSWLLKSINFDNSEFSSALNKRSFEVVQHAQNNYAATLHSLASILNMEYIKRNSSPYSDLDFLRLLVTDNDVARQLQQIGYTYIQLLSGFWIPNPNADIIRDFTPSGMIEIDVTQNDFSTAMVSGLPKKWKTIPELSQYYKQSFWPLYLNTTILRILHSQLGEVLYRNDSTPYSLFDPSRFLDTVDEVESIAQLPEATFTVIHLLKPHLPVVFDEQGRTLAKNWEPSNNEVISQLKFVNSKFLQMIDTIIHESRNPPVIIFQADHGSTHVDGDKKFRDLAHFAPYAAYFLPEVYTVRFPEPFTLINTFPLLLNEIFQTDFELNEDRLFELPLGYKAPFEQIDVTRQYLGK